MNSIIYIGMDVHTANYTFCAYTREDDKTFERMQDKADFEAVIRYIEKINNNFGGGCEFVCGYEAGCLGYTLYNQMTNYAWKNCKVECVIMAPSTMAKAPGDHIKTDMRDARKIAECLASGQYSKVFVLDEEDEATKAYIRMRDDAQAMLKTTKQQINAFCILHGKVYDGKSKWTQVHMRWLDELTFSNALLKEILKEYLHTYSQLVEKVDTFDKRIEELSHGERYAEKVSKLRCIKGIETHTAMALVTEIGDYNRFPTAPQFSAFLGLVPSENSSSKSIRRGSITKAGNNHLRWLLVEAACHYNRVKSTRKSKALKAKQQGNSPEVIQYADRANERLRKKYQKIANRTHKANLAKTAVARELSCFIWGMMTGHIECTAQK